MGKEERRPRSQEGTGSAEQTNGSRQDQSSGLNEHSYSPHQKGGLRDMGALSGRDDYAGDCNDGMEDQNSGEETER